tara:strand:+ start:228 stop:386 length:159 start_codon:yes stop_codon:yes gene_type:complete
MQDRKERMSEQWWEALAEYGNEEAVHVCSELWGYSIYRTLKEIERIEEESWL